MERIVTSSKRDRQTSTIRRETIFLVPSYQKIYKVAMRDGKIRNAKNEEEKNLEESKSTEAIFSDVPAGVGIVDIDEHVFFRVARQKTGKDLDELFFVSEFGLIEAFCHVKPVGSFSAIEPYPVTRATGS
jgi:hypothetical protein